jgi:hypothetical protein
VQCCKYFRLHGTDRMIAGGGTARGFVEKSLGTKVILAFVWRD